MPNALSLRENPGRPGAAARPRVAQTQRVASAHPRALVLTSRPPQGRQQARPGRGPALHGTDFRHSAVWTWGHGAPAVQPALINPSFHLLNPTYFMKPTFFETCQKLCASQVGQRRGKMGVKRAKNFHVLMKGKITHLARGAAQPVRRCCARLLLNAFAVWLEQKRHSPVAGGPAPPSLGVLSLGCRRGRPGTHAPSDSDDTADIWEAVNIF